MGTIIDLFATEPRGIANSKALTTAATTYGFLAELTLSAHNALKQRQFKQFDALVGEASCQIRAVKVALIGMEMIEAFKKIEPKLTKIIQLASDKSNTKKNKNPLRYLNFQKMNSQNKDGAGSSQSTIQNAEHIQNSRSKKKFSIDFEEIVERAGLSVHLTEDQLFLIKSHFLCLVKASVNVRESTEFKEQNDYSKLSEFTLKPSNSLAEKFSRKFRRELACYSVNFVENEATKVDDPDLMTYTGLKWRHEHVKWLCNPMFWTYKTLLEVIKTNKIAVILRAVFDDEVMHEVRFIPNHGARNIAIIVEGDVEYTEYSDAWEDKIRSDGFEKIILAGAAHHRQYPGSADTEKFPKVLEHPLLMSYREIADKEGYGSSNKSTFFIQHVFAEAMRMNSSRQQLDY